MLYTEWFSIKIVDVIFFIQIKRGPLTTGYVGRDPRNWVWTLRRILQRSHQCQGPFTPNSSNRVGNIDHRGDMRTRPSCLVEGTITVTMIGSSCDLHIVRCDTSFKSTTTEKPISGYPGGHSLFMICDWFPLFISFTPLEIFTCFSKLLATNKTLFKVI